MDILITLSSGKQISLTQDEYLELKEFFNSDNHGVVITYSISIGCNTDPALIAEALCDMVAKAGAA